MTPRIGPAAPVFLGAAIALVPALPASAQMRLYTDGARAAEARRDLPGEARTAAGDLFLPRYLRSPGQYEIALDQAIVVSSAPLGIAGSSLPGASAMIKVFPFLDLYAAVGPHNRVGFRGPVYQSALLGLGWAGGYRADIVGTGRTSNGTFLPGIAPPGTGAPVVPWSQAGVAVSRGGEIRLEGLNRIALDAGFLDLGLSPYGYAMGNRAGGGAAFSIDWALDRMAFGYTGVAEYNAVNPQGQTVPIAPLELAHGLGARFLLSEGAFLHVGYRFVQTDTYQNTWHLITASLGHRSPSVRAPEGSEEPAPAPATTNPAR